MAQVDFGPDSGVNVEFPELEQDQVNLMIIKLKLLQTSMNKG